jgi:hypothetical protein
MMHDVALRRALRRATHSMHLALDQHNSQNAQGQQP